MVLKISKKGEISKKVIVHIETGTIVIAPASYFISEGGKPQNIIIVPKGKYTFSAFVSSGSTVGWFNDMNKLKTKGELDLPNGLLVVDDPCYSFKNQKKWDEYLDKTHLMKKLPGGVYIINTGGDGEGVVEITLNKI
jgi:hypothetical protein